MNLTPFQKVELIIGLTFGAFYFLPPSAGIAVGFYGNGESSDGANRLAYSLRHANRTVSGVEKLVSHLLDFKTFLYFCKTPPTAKFKNTTDRSFLGVRQRPSLKPDCGGEPGPVRDGLPGSDGLRVHRPEAAGTAGRAGEADGGCSLLVQH